MTNSVSFRRAAAEEDSSAEDVWLRCLVWERSAPDALVEAARHGQVLRFSRAWKQRVRERLAAEHFLLRGLLSAWSAAPPASELLQSRLRACQNVSRRNMPLSRALMKASTSWTVHVQPLWKALMSPSCGCLETPLGLLAALELLTTGNRRLPQRLWWPLWQATLQATLRRFATEPSRRGAVESTSAEPFPDQTLLEQGELPFLVGAVFGDLAGGAALMQRGRRALKRALLARTDTDGTPHSALLPRLPLWLAGLVRSTVWSRCWQVPLWDKEETQRLNDLAERAVALCRGDGRFALTNGLPVEPLPMLQHAAELLGWSPRNPALAALRCMARQVRQGPPVAPRAATALQVMPSAQSDWARVAVLRSDWGPAAESVALTHHEPLPQVEITAGGTVIMQGAWGLALQLDGQPVVLADEWSCVCWVTDPDGDYAELQMLGPRGMRLERLVYLSRKDRLMLLADVVSQAPAGRLELTSKLPLAPQVEVEPETTTRSVHLRAGSVQGRVFPLALPQSRVFSTPHQLDVAPGSLVLRQTVPGTGLMAPLIFDWDPTRSRQPAEWRSLTVTENGRIVRADVAAGFRLRIGDDQWLVYRSLKRARTARAVLGHHTPHETVIARFTPQGDAEPLLMIEAG